MKLLWSVIYLIDYKHGPLINNQQHMYQHNAGLAFNAVNGNILRVLQ